MLTHFLRAVFTRGSLINVQREEVPIPPRSGNQRTEFKDKTILKKTF
ncbi:hypothetical protein KIS4809_1930 [Bacillus sp. ZZV12-4809]|nr:hypothetical protein KIS4809_1930 [Bacillus sp. ZZV12-4809]